MEKIKVDIISCINKFTLYFKREYKNNNFFSYDTDGNNFFSNFNELSKIWEIKIKEPVKVTNINERYLFEINNKIYTYYKYLLEKYNYSTEDRTEFNDMISKIFLLLSNIYDLFPNFLEIYFKEEWLKLHLKLIDACLDINNPPEPSLGSNGKEKIDKLYPFLLFFSLCFSKDTNFNTRLYLIIKHPDLFYKIAIISANNGYFCCCGHDMNYSDNRSCSVIKSIFLVFETFSYMESNKIDYEAANKVKMKILEFLFKNIGKNVCIVLLYQMGKMLNIDNLFNHILNNTNLLGEALSKESEDCFSHAIEGFEAFIILSKNPEVLFKILNILTPPDKGLKNRIYREILKKISNIIINNNQIEYLENKLYNNIIFSKVLDTLKQNTYLGDYEGIWQILLDSNNSNIVTIFYRNKNKYNIGEIMMNQINYLIKNNMTGIRLNGVVRIMNLFLKIGNEIKKKYNIENYFVEQFRDCYKNIHELDIKDDEDFDEFKKYFDSN